MERRDGRSRSPLRETPERALARRRAVEAAAALAAAGGADERRDAGIRDRMARKVLAEVVQVEEKALPAGKCDEAAERARVIIAIGDNKLDMLFEKLRRGQFDWDQPFLPEDLTDEESDDDPPLQPAPGPPPAGEESTERAHAKRQAAEAAAALAAVLEEDDEEGRAEAELRDRMARKVLAEVVEVEDAAPLAGEARDMAGLQARNIIEIGQYTVESLLGELEGGEEGDAWARNFEWDRRLLEQREEPDPLDEWIAAGRVGRPPFAEPKPTSEKSMLFTVSSFLFPERTPKRTQH